MTRITDDPVADAENNDIDNERACSVCAEPIDKGTICSECAADAAFDDWKDDRINGDI